MPEFGAELLGSLGLDALFTAGADTAATAGLDAAATAGADAGLAAGFGAGSGAIDLAGAAGLGELGSVATGLGPAGVSAFGDTAGIAAALGASDLGAVAGLGIPAAAGIGEIGAVADPSSIADALLGTGASAGTGIDVTGAIANAVSGLTTSNASLSQPSPVGPDVVSSPPQPAGPPQPTSFSGTTSVGPTAGTPAGALNATSFDTAQPVIGGQAPAGASAVNPVGAAGSASSDLTTGGAINGAPKAAETGSKSFLDKMVSGAGKSIENNWLPALIGAGALGFNVLKGSQQAPATTAMGQLPAANANLAATSLGQIQPTTDIRDKATGAAGTALGQGTGLVDKGTGFTGYLPTGTLPPDMQAALDSATSANKTRIISNHASRNLPTDPKKNSVLAQELAQADRDALTTKSQMESELLKSGTSLIAAGNQTTGEGNALLNTGNSSTQVVDKLVGTGLNASGLTGDIYTKLVSMDKADQKAISDAIANFSKALGGTGGGLSLKLA